MKNAPLAALFLLCGCAYFNTFYNAQEYYGEAKKAVTHDTLRTDSELFDKTIEKATRVIVKYPGSRYVDDALFLMGASYCHKGDYERALEKLDYLCQNFPESGYRFEANYYRGLALYHLGRLSAAIPALNAACEHQRHRKKALFALVYVHQKGNDHENVITTCRELLKLRLKVQEKRIVLGHILDAQFNLKQYAAAITTAQDLLKNVRLPEERKRLKLRLAQIYLETNDYDLCRGFLEGEVDPEFKLLLAQLHEELDDPDAACVLYQEVIQSRLPEHAAQAFYALGARYEAMDSLSQAIAYYDSAASRGTSPVGNEARHRAAILNRVVQLLADSVARDSTTFFLGETYFVDLDDPARALTYYEAVHTGYPRSRWAAKALYAQFWINLNVIVDDSLAQMLGKALLERYPTSEYAASARVLLGRDQNQEPPPE